MAIAAAASLTAQDKSYTAPRTPWGHPDLQGVALRLLGGINVFGGGLALYNSDGRLLGGLGVSGDSSCADHNIIAGDEMNAA